MRAPRLVLVRHAQAGNPGDWDGADRDRPLTDKGQVSAVRMAQALGDLLPGSVELLCSPYLRARQTAIPLSQALDVPVRQKKWLAPGQPTGLEVEALARNLPADGGLVIVGHEPDLSLLVSCLLGTTGGRSLVHMGKGDACGLTGALPGPMQLAWHLPRRILERLAGGEAD
ncbi:MULTISPECIES: histidine phosphatase family protein [Thioalkalivibrio]|uniref:Phosphohistidine phosphatase n=1 Tax=Thioalkalivibrio versutus TaxID=106634 RepID=A0A0G3G239_9GAMM|nr:MULTISPECIES: histidine phosphatase family protein [Thioalkalivibrio]AKJ95273.1 phosphohistidine phosphatase [Thioalkalivibrio versutus]OOC51142.1 histidine phosphatase family protein [Thioalkalivibrio versutus]